MLLFDESCDIVSFPYVIEAKIEGAELRKQHLCSAEIQGVLATVGGLLRRMHSVRTRRFGVLLEDLVGASDTWDFVERRFSKELGLLRSAQLLPRNGSESAFRRFFEIVTPLQCEDPRLLHNDLHASNVLVLGNELSGIIDLGDAVSGDPEYNLARAYQGFHVDYDQLVTDRLLDGYGPFDHERFEYYLVYHACWTLRWFQGRGEIRYADRSRQLISRVLSHF